MSPLSRPAHAVAVVGTRRPTETGRAIAARIGGAWRGRGGRRLRPGGRRRRGEPRGGDGRGRPDGRRPRLGSRAALPKGACPAGLTGSSPTAARSCRSWYRTRPSPSSFPRRNRLISGLADATVVVEAGPTSGALITAAWALQQGRDLFMVPGSIDAPESAGCLAWLRDYPGQARIVASVPHLIHDLELAGDAGEVGRSPVARRRADRAGRHGPGRRGRAGPWPRHRRRARRGDRTHRRDRARGADDAGAPRARDERLRPLPAGRGGWRRPPSIPWLAGNRWTSPRPEVCPAVAARARLPQAPTEPPRGLTAPRCCVVPQRTEPGVCPLLRKLAAALLAVPVIAVLYLPILVRRSVAARIGLAIGVGGLVALGALGLISPTRTTASKPPPIVPLAPAEFTSAIVADQELDASVDLAFSGPMDQRSVAASLDVKPRTAVSLSWDATGSRLTVRPAGRWSAGTYYTVTVRAGALGQSGRPMAVPARAVFLTRQATTGRIAPTLTAGEEVRSRPGSASRSIARSPSAPSARRSASTHRSVARSTSRRRRRARRFRLHARRTARDVDPVHRRRRLPRRHVGRPLRGPGGHRVTTAAPRSSGSAEARDPNVARSAKLSVRFTQSMDPATTKAALGRDRERQGGRRCGLVRREGHGAGVQAVGAAALRRRGRDARQRVGVVGDGAPLAEAAQRPVPRRAEARSARATDLRLQWS